MISRRLLRIKALQALYAFNRKDGDELREAEKELIVSIEKAYDLYLYLLSLFVELSDVAAERIEMALQKKMPTMEDTNPNKRFINNQIVKILQASGEIEKVNRERKINWTGHRETPRALYSRMISWEAYIDYMRAEENTVNRDRKFLNHLLSGLLLETEDLISHLEERSIYWNDDLEFAVIMIEKTLKRLSADIKLPLELMPLYKNDEDREFAVLLLRNALINNKMIRELIDSNTTNWEIERIALMDILVMQLAIAEIMAFPEIPVKVTLNEYIEIAKYYCTSKSSTFINGILDKVVKEMRGKGLFEKSGRGLIGELKDE